MNNPKKVGRPLLPATDKKKRITVSMVPAADDAWGKLARKAKVSKGQLAVWLSCAPEAEEARKQALRSARYFVFYSD